MDRKIMKRIVDGISKEDRNFEELLWLANNEIFLELITFYQKQFLFNLINTKYIRLESMLCYLAKKKAEILRIYKNPLLKFQS